MIRFKFVCLLVAPFLVLASYQAEASHYSYNDQNHMVSINDHHISYSISGDIAQVDSLKFIDNIMIQGNIASTRFGGVRLLSDGTYSTTFSDGHNTIKTSKSRTYSGPYGNHKPVELDIHNNIKIFGGSLSILDLQYMSSRWYFPNLRRFGSEDSYDVANRFNIDNGNPVMNYDPSGHNALNVVNTILMLTTGIDASSAKSLGTSIGIAIAVDAVLGGVVGLIVYKYIKSVRAAGTVALEAEVNKLAENNAKKIAGINLDHDNRVRDLENKANARIQRARYDTKNEVTEELNKQHNEKLKSMDEFYNKVISDNEEQFTKRFKGMNEQIRKTSEQHALENEYKRDAEMKSKLNEIISQNKREVNDLIDTNKTIKSEFGQRIFNQESDIRNLRELLSKKYNKSPTHKANMRMINDYREKFKRQEALIKDLRENMSKNNDPSLNVSSITNAFAGYNS